MGIRRTLYDWLGKKLSSVDDDEFPSSDSVGLQDIAAYAAAVHMVAGYIGAAVANAEIRFYEPGGGLAEPSAPQWLWTTSPNPNQSHYEFFIDLVERMLTDRRGALVVPARLRGSDVLWVADGFTEHPDPGRPTRYETVSVGRSTSFAGARKSYLASDVYYFRLRSPAAKAVLDALGEAYDSMAAKAASAYDAQSAQRYKLKMPATESGDAEFRTKWDEYISDALRSFLTNNRTVWTEFRGQELEPLKTEVSLSTSASSDFDALVKGAFERVAVAYGMPVSMLYGNVNNFEQVFGSFLTFAVDPVARLVSDEITRKTYTADEWAAGARVVVDTSRIKHYDIIESAEGADKLISSSLMTPNQVLHVLGLDPVPDAWADEHVLTKNYERVDGGENDEG